MESSGPKPRPRLGPWPPPPESKPMPPPPASWAARTGFRPKFSGEANAGDSGQVSLPPRPPKQPDLDSGKPRNGEPVGEKVSPSGGKDQAVKRRRDSDGVPKSANLVPNGGGVEVPPAQARRAARSEEAIDVLPESVVVDEDGLGARHSHMRYELRDTPGLVPIGLYGFQHFLSLLGSLILIPLVIVPAMGGTQEDTSIVVSTVLFISGVTTLLHTSFGSRLPLIQGPSFVYLAPALVIINSPEFQGLDGNKFKHVMKELQGAIIIASAFQAVLGYSGLMSALLRYNFIIALHAGNIYFTITCLSSHSMKK